MRRVHYDDEDTASTETHMAVDEQMDAALTNRDGRQARAYREGFAASSGIRPETAESGGRIDHPESKDTPRRSGQAPSIEKQNAGLADA